MEAVVAAPKAEEPKSPLDELELFELKLESLEPKENKNDL